MAELIAVGKNNQQRCWPSLPEQEPIMLGRAPRHGLSVPWDPLISREHAHLALADGKLTVRELATARNPILLGGRPSKQFSRRAARASSSSARRGFVSKCASRTPAERQTVAEHMLDGKGVATHFENASACLAALCQMPASSPRREPTPTSPPRSSSCCWSRCRGSLAAAVLQFNVRRRRVRRRADAHPLEQSRATRCSGSAPAAG